MQPKNSIGYLVNSYRAVFKKNHIINIFGYIVLVAMLATGGISGTFMVTADIAAAQAPGNHFSDSKKDFMVPNVLFTVRVHPNSSLHIRPQNVSGIRNGTNLVIEIVRTKLPPTTGPGSIAVTGGVYIEHLWLEAPQEVLEIDEKEITIAKWSKLAFRITGQAFFYFSSNGSGVLKIKRGNEKLLSGGQEASYHGTASFHFTDPSYQYSPNSNPKKSIDWTFLITERKGALLFPNKESN